MDLDKYVLFSEHTTTGSIYYSRIIDTENARSVRFWVEGQKNAGVGASWSIWFDHAARANSQFIPFNRMVILGLATAEMNKGSWVTTLNIASQPTGTISTGYVHPDFMPNCLQVRYEISAVAASAGAGTMSGFMTVSRDTSH